MKTLVEDVSSVKKKLIVEIEADEVDKRINDAYKSLKKRAKMPGFRPGKIPRNLLERYYGDQVINDVTRELVRDTLPQAVEETQTFPLVMPLVDNESLKQGTAFRYTAVLEVKPQFALNEYRGLEVKKEICAVTEEAVDKQIEEIRMNSGKLQPLEIPRGVQEGDFVIIEYEGFEGGEPIEGVKGTNFLLRIGSGDFHPDFEKALVGLNPGDDTETRVSFASDHYHDRLAGKSVDFKVRIVDIKALELPEINDDFARGLGAEFEGLEDMRTRIREDLVKREEKRIDRELKRRLLKRISDGVDFELPECLVESEIDRAMENIRQNLMRSGSDMEKAGFQEERLRQDFRPMSQQRVKDMLILAEIARENDLQVSETELNDGFRELAEGIGQEPEVVRKYYEANQGVEAYRERLLEEKTLNFLVNGARITEVEADGIPREEGSEKPAS